MVGGGWWVIGIDPDYRVHVCWRLLDLHDGPILELGIKKMDGEKRGVAGAEAGRQLRGAASVRRQTNVGV